MNFAKDRVVCIEVVEVEVFFKVATEEDCNKCAQALTNAKSYGKMDLTYLGGNTINGYIVSLILPINEELGVEYPFIIDASAILRVLHGDTVASHEPRMRMTFRMDPDADGGPNVICGNIELVDASFYSTQFVGYRTKLRKTTEINTIYAMGLTSFGPFNPDHNPEHFPQMFCKQTVKMPLS